MSDTLSSKIQNNIRENEEKKLKERKKHLLYLILNYLKENLLTKTAESLFNEANLSENIQLCDNVDLDIIFQEYYMMYYMKFKKYPNICKKIDALKINSSEIKSNKSILSRSIKSAPSKPKRSIKTDGETNFYISCIPLNENCSEESSNNEKFDNSIMLLDLNYNDEMKEIAELILKETIVKKSVHINWDDIQGLEAQKFQMKEALLFPIKYPKLFSKIPIPWKGILLYGPPGTGKTLLVKAIATQCSNTFFNITPSTLISKWRGESEKLAKALFQLAKQNAPSIIFIDEIDAIASKREEVQHEASRRFKSELLIQLDGLFSTDDNIFILATTNLPWEIDVAILRRFEKKILFDLPNFENRCALFKYYLNQMSDMKKITSEDLRKFSSSTEGYSGSDIKIVCKEAVLIPIRKQIIGNNNFSNTLSPLEKADVLSAINCIKSSVKNLSEKYHMWEKNFGSF